MKPTMRVAGAAMVFAVAFSGLGASPASAEPDFGLDDDYSWSPVETSTDYFSDAFEDLSIGEDADYSFGDDLGFSLGDDFTFDTDYSLGAEEKAQLDELNAGMEAVGEFYNEGNVEDKLQNAKPGEVLGTFQFGKSTVTFAKPPADRLAASDVGGKKVTHCTIDIFFGSNSSIVREAVATVAAHYRNSIRTEMLDNAETGNHGNGIQAHFCHDGLAASDVSDPKLEASQVSTAGAFGLIVLGFAVAQLVQMAVAATMGTFIHIFESADFFVRWQKPYEAFQDCLTVYVGAWATFEWPAGGWGIPDAGGQLVRAFGTCMFAALSTAISWTDIKKPETQAKIGAHITELAKEIGSRMINFWHTAEEWLSTAFGFVGSFAANRGHTFTANARLYWNRIWGGLLGHAAAAAAATWQHFQGQHPADANYSEEPSFGADSFDLDGFDLGSFDTNYSEELSFGADSFDLDGFDLGSFDTNYSEELSFDVSGLDFGDDDYSFLGDFGGTDDGSYLDFGLADSFGDLDLVGALG